MSSQESLWYSRKAQILKKLSPEETETLYAHSTRLLKTRGEIIWVDEEESPKVFVVDQGYIRICRVSDDGKRVILSILGPSEFFGALSPELKTSDPNECIEVVRDARLIAIDASVFQQTLQQHPEMSLRILQVLETRKRTLENRISSLLFKDVYARTAELLIELCQKHGQECPHAPGMLRDLHLTHQEIADLVGAARPTVSTIVGSFIKAKLLHKHNHFLCFTQMEGLKLIAELGIKALEPLGAADPV